MDQVKHPLRVYRDSVDLSLAALAAQAGTSKATLSRFENGKQTISVELSERLSTITGISPRKLRPDIVDLAERLTDFVGESA